MDPLERWRRHLRRRCDAGAASIASYVVAAAVFIISSTVLLHFVVEPPGAMTNELEHLGLRTKAEETLALLVGAPGLPHAWDADFAAIESIQRLGLVERGTTARIDPDKFDALARGKLAIASAGNGGVDYAEAKAALGLSGYDFHLRAYPILKPGSDDPYGLSGFDAYRVAYVGHHANDGSITPEAQAEANALAGLNIDFNNGHRTLLAAGDVYKDTSGDLRDGLLPHIGALVEQTVISQGAGTKFDFHRVSAGAYSAFVPGSLTPPLTAALALSSDGATLGYAKNRELRAIVGKVDLTGVSANAGLTWREWVDTDRGNLSYDCDDYGFVEVSPNNGATWVRLTDTPAARSRDCADPLSGTTPHPPQMRQRSVSDIIAGCASCANNPHVLVAFHWIADNDNTIGYGWVVDDVVVKVGLSTQALMRKTFEAPTYDMVIIGSDVENHAFTPQDVKEAIRDYVDKYGGRIIITGPSTNVQWLDRLFDAGTAGASGGVATPDVTHPLLTLPNTLDHPSYQHKLTWDFSKSEDADLFHPVVAASPREHVLSVSRLGAWGNGTTNEGSVLLTTYLPHAMSSEEARRFYANGIAYGKFHYLYLEVGPEVPKSTSVASAVRTATMNMYRTGAPSYIEMAFILYVWEGASAAATTGATSVPATAPPTLAADAGDAQITLTWTRPLANGSATPFEFHIWRGSSPDTTQDVGIRVPYGSWSSAPLTFVDSGPHLQNGDTYYYTVRLETRVNAQLPGTAVLGAPSAVASATPIGLPGAPGQPTATSGLGRVTLEWTPPAQTGGGAIYGYAVYASPASATPRAFTLLGEVGSTTAYAHFVPDTAERVYRVEALNARGFGPASAESAPAGAIAPIDPPALAVSAGVGPGNLTLTWAAPDTLGQTLVGYRIYRATTAAGAFTELAYLNEPLAVSFADVGLGANATRWYKVQGVTSLGDGQNSSAQSQKTMATPDTPTGLAVTRVPATNTHTISWLPPVQSDWPVVRYDVWRGTSASNLQFVKSASTTSTTDTPGSGTWWYAVRAVSAAGASDLTAAVRP